jgi:hypothetical protein
MQMECVGGRCRRRLCHGLFLLPRRAVGTTRQRNEHLPRVLEIAPPQQRSTLTCKAIRGICGHGVIGNDHARGR